MSKDTGGPAFPQTQTTSEGPVEIFGLSVRDYFAAKAMQGICANRSCVVYAGAAEEAYRMADAMITERSKP